MNVIQLLNQVFRSQVLFLLILFLPIVASTQSGSGTICNQTANCNGDGPPYEDVCPGGSTGNTTYDLSQNQSGTLIVEFTLTRGSWMCPGGTTYTGQIAMNITDTYLNLGSQSTGTGGSPGFQISGTRIISNIRANQPLQITFSGTGSYSFSTSFTATQLNDENEPNDNLEDAIGISISESVEGNLGFGTHPQFRDSDDWYHFVFPAPGSYAMNFDTITSCTEITISGSRIVNFTTGVNASQYLLDCISAGDEVWIKLNRKAFCGTTNIKGYEFSIDPYDRLFENMYIFQKDFQIRNDGTFSSSQAPSSIPAYDIENDIELQKQSVSGWMSFFDYRKPDTEPLQLALKSVVAGCDWSYIMYVDECGYDNSDHILPLSAYQTVLANMSNLDPQFFDTCLADDELICTWMSEMGNEGEDFIIPSSEDVLHGLLKVWLVQKWTQEIMNHPQTDLLIDNFVDFYKQIILNLFEITNFLENHVFEFEKTADWETFVGLVESLFDNILSNCDLSGSQKYLLSKQFKIFTSLDSKDFGSKLFKGFAKDGFGAILDELANSAKEGLKEELKMSIKEGVERACFNLSPTKNGGIESIYSNYLAATDSEMSELVELLQFSNNYYATIFSEITSGFSNVASTLEDSSSLAPIFRSLALVIRGLNTANYVATSTILNVAILETIKDVKEIPNKMISNANGSNFKPTSQNSIATRNTNPYLSDVLDFNNEINTLKNLSVNQDSAGIANYENIFKVAEKLNFENLYKYRSDYLIMTDSLISIDEDFKELFYQVEIKNSHYSIRKALVYENLFSILNENPNEYEELEKNLDSLSYELDSIILYKGQMESLLQNYNEPLEAHLLVLDNYSTQIYENVLKLNVEIMNIGTIASEVDTIELDTRDGYNIGPDSLLLVSSIAPKEKQTVEFIINLASVDTNYVLPYFMDFIGNNNNNASYKMGYSPMLGGDEYTCISDLNLSENLQIDRTYDVLQGIISNSTINENTDIKYNAGATICLENGFEVKVNATFEADIKNCANE